MNFKKAIALCIGFLGCVFINSCTSVDAHSQKENALLKLWYRQPAQNWNEALPVGNGRLGAMVFGGVDTAEWQLNEATLWSGGPHDGNNPGAKEVLPQIRKALFDEQYEKGTALAKKMMGPYTSRYLTLGSLYLDMQPSSGNVTNYRRQLDLNNAVAATSCQRDGVTYTRETFSSYPDQVLVIRLKSGKQGGLSFNTRFNNPMPATLVADGNNQVVMKGKCPAYVANRVYDKRQIVYDTTENGEGMRYEVRLLAQSKDGEVSADTAGLHVKNASEVVLLLSVGTSFNGFDKSPGREGKDPHKEAQQYLQKAAAKTYDQLLADHEKDYKRLFDRVNLDLGSDSSATLPTDVRLKEYTEAGGYRDPQLTTLLFQYGRYLLIAASRPGGQPANLQGIWNNSLQPPWGSNYTININTEMNYWPAEKDNLSECAEPLFHFIGELAKRGAVTARVNYGARGWVSHHNSDIWAQTAPPGNYGKDPGGKPRWAMWPMSGAWFCRHLWEHYLFTGDKDFLEQTAYPLMKGASLFMLDWLIPYQDHLVTSPSTSPENNFLINGKRIGSVSVATTMDMSIIRDLFFNTIRASEIMNTDEDFRKQLQDAYKKLYPFHVGQYGQLQEWYKDWDDPKDDHRHVSHLYGLFPADLISPRRTPLLAAAAKKSLELRGDGGTGWSKSWKVNWWARLEDGDHAYMMLNKQLYLAGHRHDDPDSRGGSYMNLLDAHPPFQIDGNFGVTSGITEMLLQSQNGAVYLLPALPKIWAKGSISGLKARGGFTIKNMEWENGHLKKAAIVSTLGGVCRIRTKTPVKINGAESKPVEDNAVNPNPFFQTPPLETPVIKDKSKIEKLSLSKTYLVDVETKPGTTLEIIAQ